MKVKNLNSLVFQTENLPALKSFYSDILFLDVAEYVENGNNKRDLSSNHINYILGETLLCFEQDNRTDKGTIIFNVDNLSESKEILKNLDIQIIKDSKDWIMIEDPDGRNIIFE